MDTGKSTFDYPQTPKKPVCVAGSKSVGDSSLFLDRMVNDLLTTPEQIITLKSKIYEDVPEISENVSCTRPFLTCSSTETKKNFTYFLDD